MSRTPHDVLVKQKECFCRQKKKILMYVSSKNSKVKIQKSSASRCPQTLRVRALPAAMQTLGDEMQLRVKQGKHQQQNFWLLLEKHCNVLFPPHKMSAKLHISTVREVGSEVAFFFYTFHKYKIFSERITAEYVRNKLFQQIWFKTTWHSTKAR